MNAVESRAHAAVLRRLEIVDRRVGRTAGVGTHHGRARGRGTDFADYREYSPGDDPRHVDWSLYARLGKLFTRSFEATTELDLELLVDVSASMGAPSPRKLEHAAAVALVLASVAVGRHDGVGLTTFSDRVHARLPARRGPAQLRRIRDVLRGCSPHGRSGFAAAMREYRGARGPRSAVVVVLSDFLPEGSHVSGLRPLLASTLGPILVHVVDPLELDPQLAGETALIDAEEPAAPPFLFEPDAIGRYRENLRRFLAGVAAWCSSRGLTYVRTDSSESFGQVNRLLLQAGVWRLRS